MARAGETIVRDKGQLTGDTQESYEKTGQNRRWNRRKRTLTINRADIAREVRITEYKVVFNLPDTDYLVDGSIGFSKETMYTINCAVVLHNSIYTQGKDSI